MRKSQLGRCVSQREHFYYLRNNSCAMTDVLSWNDGNTNRNKNNIIENEKYEDSKNKSKKQYKAKKISPKDRFISAPSDLSKQQIECIQQYLQKQKPYSRSLSNSKFQQFYNKASIECYGHGNRSKLSDKFKSFNVNPHRFENNPEYYQTYASSLNYGKKNMLNQGLKWRKIALQIGSKVHHQSQQKKQRKYKNLRQLNQSKQNPTKLNKQKSENSILHKTNDKTQQNTHGLPDMNGSIRYSPNRHCSCHLNDNSEQNQNVKELYYEKQRVKEQDKNIDVIRRQNWRRMIERKEENEYYTCYAKDGVEKGQIAKGKKINNHWIAKDKNILSKYAR